MEFTYNDFYDKITAPVRTRPKLVKALKLTNKALTYVTYVLFFILVYFKYREGLSALIRLLIVTGVPFVVVSLFRVIYNSPRPYEKGINPLLHKETKGKSFPSRHVFSIFIIAVCWLKFSTPIGIMLITFGVILGIIRVILGVHFPKDVLCGALVGILCGLI